MGAGMPAGGGDRVVRRVFVSVAGPDLAWGRWVDRQLRDAGYRVDFYPRTFPAGGNFVDLIDDALERADRVVALLSRAYVDRRSWVREEWQAALRLAHDRPAFLVPVLVEACEPRPLLGGLNAVTLFGMDEEAARDRLLAALGGATTTDGAGGRPPFPGRGKPVTSGAAAGVPFPAGTSASAGQLPTVTVLHLPDPGFGPDPAGRDAFGDGLRDDLGWLAAGQDVQPDMVVVTGVAVSGRKADYQRAAEALGALLDTLGLGRHRAVVVPGRGDVSAAASRAYFAACEDDETEPVRPYWRKWRHFTDFFTDFYRNVQDVDAATFAVGREWSLFTLPDLRVVVAGVNSTMAMSHLPGDDHAEVGAAQARWFTERLASFEHDGWFRLGVGYHPPFAGSGFDTRTLPDADTVDLMLGGHLNLTVVAYGADPVSRAGPAPDTRTEAARLRRSGAVLVAAAEAHPAAQRHEPRYQVLRVDHEGFTRWDRRFDVTAGAWRADGRRGSGRPASYLLRWDDASATFPATTGDGGRRRGEDADPEQRDQRDERGPVAGAEPRDDLFARVAEVARLRNPGAAVTRIEAAGGVPAYLRLTVTDGPVVAQRPVGVHNGVGAGAGNDIDMGVVDAFVDHVHRAYAAADPQLGSDLVYTGELAGEALVRYAAGRGVRLVSFVEYQGLLDLRGYVRRQTGRLDADRLYPPQLYLPQRFRLVGRGPVEDDRAAEEDLLSRVVEWMAADTARFVLVLGDFGRGKTFLLHELARTLPQRLSHLVPLLVDLRSMEKAHGVDELVASHLVASGEQRVDVAAFRYMLRSGRLVLLFDGFDELALRVTYETAAEHLSRLLDAVNGQAKIVVTSRTQHFLSHGQVRSALGARVELLPASRVAEVEDFTDSQIEEFLVRLFGGDADRAAARLELIRDIRDLLGLARNPRMLGFIAGLDEARLRAVQTRAGVISSAELYAELVDEWLRHEENRSRPVGAGPTLTAEERREAVTALALRLWQTTDRLISLAELTTSTAAVLASMSERGLDEGQAAHAIGSGSLLVRAEDGGFTFIHSSVMEYLVAAAAGVWARDAGSGSRAEVLSVREMSPLMVDFFCGTAGRARAVAWAREVFADADASPAARRNALAVAHSLDRAATRAAKLGDAQLDAADLTGLDLTGADLSGADLGDARLVRTDLSGAVLRGARLVGARLEKVSLAGADLTGADLTDTRLIEPDLTGATITGSTWARAAILGLRPEVSLPMPEELTSAAIAGVDPVRVASNPAGARWCVAFSPTGDLLVYSIGEHVLLADLREGQILSMLDGHTGRIRSLAFSPTGDLLASGGVDRAICLWDISSRSLKMKIENLGGRVNGLAYSPDGKILASGVGDGLIYLWKELARRPAAVLAGHTGHVRSVAFSPDGSTLASGSSDGTIRLWDVPSGACGAVLPRHTHWVNSVAFSADGTMLASAGADHVIHLWNVATRTHEATLTGHTDWVRAVAFSPIDNVLASAGADYTARLWDVAKCTPTAVLDDHADWVLGAAYAPDGRTLATGSEDGSVRLWNTRSLVSVKVRTGRTSPVRAVVFSPDGGILVSGCTHGVVRLWDSATAALSSLLGEHENSVRTLAFSPEGTLLATGSADSTVRLWDVTRRTQIAIFAGHTDHVASLAFSSDGAMIATASSDRTVRLWDVASGAQTAVLEGHGDNAWPLAFSPDGNFLVSGSAGHTLRILDVETWEPIMTLAGHTDRVWTAVFSPRTALMATASKDSTIRLWDASSFETVKVLQDETDGIWSVAFSPDTGILAGGRVDGSIQLWDVPSGTPAATLTGHSGEVAAVAFSPSGMLASGGADGTIRLWDVARRSEIASMVSLGRDGWATLFPDGSYKLDGDPAGSFWWTMKGCRFEAGELDPYVPEIRRLPADTPIPRADAATHAFADHRAFPRPRSTQS